jgi:hypothetical protein
MIPFDTDNLAHRAEVARRLLPLLDEAFAKLEMDHQLAVMTDYQLEPGPFTWRFDDVTDRLLVHVGLGPFGEAGEVFWWFAAPAARVGVHSVDGALMYEPDGLEGVERS